MDNRDLFENLQILKNEFDKSIDTAQKLMEEFKTLATKVEAVEETTGKILSYSSMTETEKADLVANIEDWKAGISLAVGDKVKRGNIAYEVIQAHTTQSDWLPENVPALFKLYVPTKTDSGEEVIADFKQPQGAHDAYKKGDKVTFEGKIYESLIDANTWSPSAYPTGWKLIV